MPAYNEHPPQWQPVKELHACYDIQATPDEIPEDRDKLIQYVLTSGDYEVAHYQGNEAAQLSVATEIADEILISRGALTSLVNSGGKREVEEMALSVLPHEAKTPAQRAALYKATHYVVQSSTSLKPNRISA